MIASLPVASSLSQASLSLYITDFSKIKPEGQNQTSDQTCSFELVTYGDRQEVHFSLFGEKCIQTRVENVGSFVSTHISLYLRYPSAESNHERLKSNQVKTLRFDLRKSSIIVRWFWMQGDSLNSTVRRTYCRMRQVSYVPLWMKAKIEISFLNSRIRFEYYICSCVKQCKAHLYVEIYIQIWRTFVSE